MKKLITLFFSLAILIPTQAAHAATSTPYQAAINRVNNASVKTTTQLKTYGKTLAKRRIKLDASVYQMDPRFMSVSLAQINSLTSANASLKNFLAKGNTITIYARATNSSGQNWLNKATQAEANYKVVNGKITVSLWLNPTYYNYTKYAFKTLPNLTKALYNESYLVKKMAYGSTVLTSTYHAKVPVQNLPVYGVTHELGHIVDYITYYKGVRSFSSSSTYGRSDAARYFNTTAVNLSNKLSIYSYANNREFFAELFASYYLNGSSVVKRFAPSILGNESLTR